MPLTPSEIRATLDTTGAASVGPYQFAVVSHGTDWRAMVAPPGGTSRPLSGWARQDRALAVEECVRSVYATAWHQRAMAALPLEVADLPGRWTEHAADGDPHSLVLTYDDLRPHSDAAPYLLDGVYVVARHGHGGRVFVSAEATRPDADRQQYNATALVADAAEARRYVLAWLRGAYAFLTRPTLTDEEESPCPAP